jgi:hypothetical protein
MKLTRRTGIVALLVGVAQWTTRSAKADAGKPRVTPTGTPSTGGGPGRFWAVPRQEVTCSGPYQPEMVILRRGEGAGGGWFVVDDDCLLARIMLPGQQ